MPVTTSIRVSDDICGSSSVDAVFTFVGPPDVFLDIGILSDTGVTTAILYVCLADITVEDPFYSTAWGTLDVIGPNPTSETICYFGSECRPFVSGNKLGETDSLVFYVDQGSICTDDPGDGIYGLSNTPGGWIDSTADATKASYASLGVVDPSLLSSTSLSLCWSTKLAGSLPLPINIGVLTLSGPVVRSGVYSCTLGGALCVITSGDSYTAANGATIMISDSNTGCKLSSSPVSWSGTTAVVSSTGGFTIGTPTAVNGYLVEESAICWERSSALFSLRVPIGVFTMYGPTHDSNAAVCYSGLTCSVPIAGVFEALTSSSLIVRDNNCASSGTVLGEVDVDNVSTKTVGSTDVNSINYEFIPGVGVNSDHPMVLCWEHATYTVPILTGSFYIVGPIPLAGSLACDLSSSCPVSIYFTLPSSDVDPLYLKDQLLKLVESDNLTEDPCMGSVIVSAQSDLASYNSGFTFFRFQSINTPKNPAGPIVVRSVCWSLPQYSSSRPVYLGTWDPVGPYSGMQVSCSLGSSCSFVINPYPEYDSNNLFFLTTNDADCKSTSFLNTHAVPLTGPASNPATYTGTAATFTIGSPDGWADGVSAGTRVFSICFSRSIKYRRGSPLGTLTLS